MLELLDNRLVFSFPEVHPDAKLAMEFQRTLRIPDDGGTYPLPPGLGRFPMAHVEDHEDKVPALWRKHGGVMIPMYQSEALWIRFLPQTGPSRQRPYPFAVKVAAGKKSAITGKDWKKGLNKSDYCVIPKQKWLDGFVVDKGMIKQFIAVPLGAGLSVEEQLGDEEIGGLQIEVFPMKAKYYEAHCPEILPQGIECWEGRIGGARGRRRRAAFKGGQSLSKSSGATNYSANSIRSDGRRSRGVKTKGLVDACSVGAADCDSNSTDALRSVDPECATTMDFSPDMAMGAGGDMRQEVFADPYGKDQWSKKVEGNRSFVHLANSMMWRAMTGSNPPTVPFTAADYRKYNFPWFDYYDDGKKVKLSGKLKGIKSVKEMAKETGQKGVLPENKSFGVHDDEVVKLGPDEVHNGTW